MNEVLEEEYVNDDSLYPEIDLEDTDKPEAQEGEEGNEDESEPPDGS